jgi:SAM-dependent methyltransferase
MGSWRDDFPPPAAPWTEAYGELHRDLVARALDDEEFVQLFRDGSELPEGYGIGFDERVVEFPWLLAQEPSGQTLDAGSALNHAHILDRLLTRIDALHIVTLHPEPVAFPERGVSYVYADLRALPYRESHFHTVVSLSTVEHIGMDNRRYGEAGPRATNPEHEADAALGELFRVLEPDGRLLLTVPYGAAEDHGWFRQFDGSDVEHLCAVAAPRKASLAVYQYASSGWQLSDLERAEGAGYRDYAADPTPVIDGAAAARAVACLRFD